MAGARPDGALQYKDINGKRMAYVDEAKATRSSSSTATPPRRTCGAMSCRIRKGWDAWLRAT